MTTRSLSDRFDAYDLFIEDIIADETVFPELRRPGLEPMWDVMLKDTPDPREPDVVTARTKGFIVGWKKRVYPKGHASAD
ncbi:MAG: hypothetical protein QM753_08880 [Thermomicrobiales bacterium]